MKKLYTRQVENLKRRLGQKGYPGALKTRKGGPGKKLGLKRNTMSHWIILQPDFMYRPSSSDGANQSDLPSTKQQSDETLENINAIAELELSGIIHIAVFLYFS